MNRSIVAITVAAMSLAALPLSAQQAARLETGVRVRITNAEGHKVIGTVAALDADTVRVARESTGYIDSTPASEIRTIEISRGTNRPLGTAKRGLEGLALGFVTGAVLGGLAYGSGSEGSSCLIICSRGAAMGFVGSIGGAAGLVIGAVAGAVTGEEQWITASRPRAGN